MPFQLRRPNGSPADLPGEVIHLYQQARDIAAAMGKIHLLRPAVLAQFISDFGEHAVVCIERWCARPMTSLDTLQNMCEGKEPLVYAKPAAATRPMPVNENPGKYRRHQAETRMVNMWQWDQKKCIEWMLARQKNIEDLNDYFLQAGADQQGNFYYSLKKEYR